MQVSTSRWNIRRAPSIPAEYASSAGNGVHENKCFFSFIEFHWRTELPYLQLLRWMLTPTTQPEMLPDPIRETKKTKNHSIPNHFMSPNMKRNRAQFQLVHILTSMKEMFRCEISLSLFYSTELFFSSKCLIHNLAQNTRVFHPIEDVRLRNWTRKNNSHEYCTIPQLYPSHSTQKAMKGTVERTFWWENNSVE